MVRGVKFAADGSGRLSSVGRDGYIKLWRLASEAGEKLWRADASCQASSSWLFALAWKPDDSSLIVTAGSAGELRAWKVVRHKTMRAESVSKKPKSTESLPTVSAADYMTASEPGNGGLFSRLSSYVNLLPSKLYGRMSLSATVGEASSTATSDKWTLEPAGAFGSHFTCEWNCVEFSKPDGCLLFAGTEDGYLIAWSVTDRLPLYAFEYVRVIHSTSIVFS